MSWSGAEDATCHGQRTRGVGRAGVCMEGGEFTTEHACDIALCGVLWQGFVGQLDGETAGQRVDAPGGILLGRERMHQGERAGMDRVIRC